MKKLIAIFGVLAFTAGMAFGQNNDATVDQTGDQNEAFISQAGQDHDAIITQDNWGLPAHYASIDQSGGDDNEAIITQSQRGASAVIEQIGSENFAGLTQSGPNDAGTSLANEAGVYQLGNNNELRNHNFLGNAYMKNGTSVDNDKNWLQVNQIGDNNKAGAWLEHHNDGTIYQEGDWNEASLNMVSNAGGEVNIADIYQKGDYNEASIIVSRTADFDGLGNWGKISQDGDLNQAFMTQNGDFNWAEITQNGNSNSATVTQTP